MRKHFLYLTNDHLIAVLWSGGRAASEQAFAADVSGHAQFAEYLQLLPPSATYLLTDLIEEDFRMDTAPHVNARDRRAMLERKLQQLYRNTPYRLAKVVGRLSEGRRDDQVLLCALTNAELVQPWIDQLLAAQVPVAGVYSVALLTADLLKALQVRSKHVLWVSSQANAGWRQTYCQDGLVRFSRLTRITSSQTPAVLLSEQIDKTVQYLESINSFSSAETLEVHVLSDRASQEALRAGLADSAQLRFVFHDIQDTSRRLALREAVSGSEATPLYLHLLERARGEQFAPSTQRRYADIRRVRLTMLSASVALALAGVMFAGWNLLQTQRLGTTIERLQASTGEYRAAQAATVAGFPKSKVNAQAMNEAVTYYEKLIREAPSFSGFARELSKVFDAFPNVQLERLIWGANTQAKVELGYQMNVQDEDSDLVALDSVLPAPAQSAGAPQGSYYQAAVIEAAVRPFSGDYRAALAAIEHFARSLGALRGARVSTLALPLDTRTENNLRGSATPEKARDEARFALYVHLSPSLETARAAPQQP